MLAVLLSWIIMSFILLSFGDFFVFIYNKFTGRSEAYNGMDILIFGICFLTILTSITSLWYPVNHYILFLCLLLSVVYWGIRSKRLINIYEEVKNKVKTVQIKYLCIFILLTVSILLYMIWSSSFFDSSFYHYQNIRWNEEYSVVPGLGNLEDRLAFNSNYFLICALFSFRFLSGEAIYALQSLLLIYFLFWIITELIQSNFELKRIILLIISLLFFSYNVDAITDTSTDIIPNICIFYLLSRLILYPNLIKKDILLFLVLPVTLVTFKVSSAPICLLSLFVFITQIKQKNYKPIYFILIIWILTICPWIVRNVIVSGYIVYPLSAIDLFSPDWKMPKSVLDSEKTDISSYAARMFKEAITFNFFRFYGVMKYKVFFINNLILVVIYIFTVISPFFVLKNYFSKRRGEINTIFYVIYCILMLYILYWFISAPDFRFANGAFMSLLFLIIARFVLKDKNLTHCNRLGKISLYIFILLMVSTSIKRFHNHYEKLQLGKNEFGKRSLSSVFIKPYGTREQLIAMNKYKGFIEYKLGDITIYLSNDRDLGQAFDLIPATSKGNLNYHGKHQEFEDLEPRGKTLQEGFRSKKKY